MDASGPELVRARQLIRSHTLAEEMAGDVVQLARDGNAFAVDLYRDLCLSTGNLLFSPFSIWAALAMVHLGARGETASEMERALRYSLPGERLGAGQEWLLRILGESVGSQGGIAHELSIANGVWVRKGETLAEEYLARVERFHRASVEVADFGGDPEGSRRAINRWVAENTRERIVDLIPLGGVSRDEGLVLANAVYFKGKWAAQFDPRKTRKLPFRAGGRAFDVPMMHQVESVGYAADDRVQVVEVPYRGQALAAVIVLPREMEGLQPLERELDWPTLQGWVDQVRPREVALTLPKFRMESSFGLGDRLGRMGMRKAFSRAAADLSGIAGKPGDLSLSAVFHRAFAAVDEEGTEAAAATAVLVLGRGLPARPVEVIADRPFLFFIRHRSTGALLFAGRVADPR